MELVLKLTEQEAQIVLNALIKEPYADVFEVVRTIQTQAGKQLDEKKDS